MAKYTSIWHWILGVYFVALALVGFWPTPVDQPAQGTLDRFLTFLHNHGAPFWFNYQFVEAAANVLLFVPVGLAGTLAFVSKKRWHIAVLGVCASMSMEAGQLIFLDRRFPSLLDVVTNVSGTLIGIHLASIFQRALVNRRFNDEGKLL
ncbi:VanZ family protein [Arthrobacter sp. ISL-28]|uniref:VanZ family protein n=1 Tax=Arthrobacter sp. ISL-28 TaxID=2819108 RepID=UPI001BE6FEBC|nr:VanZ family protein [Arthrobacter sp. ISL-28]MBT2519681.1 VanZ family protein [Arthrobacter sp. ISL-28]